jgi:predicted nucleic acid-binding protein
MKMAVYVESSVISYLAARPSNDLVKSARQAVTIDWWENQRASFDVFVSALVEEEISRGNPDAALKRQEFTSQLPNFAISDTACEIAEQLVKSKTIPRNSPEDALHIGIAAAEGAHYLLTWNFKHINNAETKLIISKLIEEMGYIPPVLCSPEELGGSND